MATFAPVTDRVVNTSWGSSRQGAAVVGAWIHHQANGAGADAVDYMIGWNERQSHPTYATDKAGRLVGIVHPDRAPSSTFYVNDQNAVAFELANVGGAPDWRVPDADLEKTAWALAHHAIESPRAAHPIEANRPGVTQAGFYVGHHSQVSATACPGPYVVARIGWLVARANEIKNALQAGTVPGSGTEKDGFLMALTDAEQRRLLANVDTLRWAHDKQTLPFITRARAFMAANQATPVTAKELAAELAPIVKQIIDEAGVEVTADAIVDEIADRLLTAQE